MIRTDLLVITVATPGTVLAPYWLGYPRLVDVSEDACRKTYIGYHADKYKWVLVLDADVVLEPAAVDTMLSAWKEGYSPCVDVRHDGSGMDKCRLMKGTQYAGGESLKDIPVYGAIAYVAG